MCTIFRISYGSYGSVIVFAGLFFIEFTNNLSKINSLAMFIDFRTLARKLIYEFLGILGRTLENTAARFIVIMAGNVFSLAALMAGNIFPAAAFFLLKYPPLPFFPPPPISQPPGAETLAAGC